MSLLASSGRATGKLRAVYIAQALNRAAGGAVIAPWDVECLPEEWLDVVTALGRDFTVAREGIRKIDEAKAKYFAGIRRQ